MCDPSQADHVLSSLLEFFKLKLEEGIFLPQLGEFPVSIASINFVKHLVCGSGEKERKWEMESREPSNIEVSGSRGPGSHHHRVWSKLI